jgi:putative endonuclease
LEARLKKHLGQHDGFTGRAKDWMQLLVEEYENKKVALRRERKLKNWKNKDRIWQFIERCHKDLYESSPSIEPVDEME